MANESEFGNFSYSFFGPMEMMFSEDDKDAVIDEPLAVKIFISFLFTVIMTAAVIGNVLTCCVIARYRSMRTPTNCYLFSLAVTDFLISLFIPFEIYILWVPEFYPFGEPGCVLHLVLLNTLSNLSVLTISAFTVERYVVVHKPFLYKKMSKNSRVFKIVAFIWIISWAFSVPESFTTDILVKKNYVLCYTTISNDIRILIAFQVVFFFIVPLTKITILYILIAIKLRSAGNHMENLPANLKHYREKVVKMLVAVAASFFFGYSPCVILRIMMIFPQHYINEDYHMTWRVVGHMCGVNGYMITAINPILYSLMSNKFRQYFKALLKGGNSIGSYSKQTTTTTPTIHIIENSKGQSITSSRKT